MCIYFKVYSTYTYVCMFEEPYVQPELSESGAYSRIVSQSPVSITINTKDRGAILRTSTGFCIELVPMPPTRVAGHTS